MAERERRIPKIAIFGGGMAGLSAAYELTSYEGWRDAYEVTVYQVGWRLGGKTASGRGAHGRIEEHGVHMLQGWYHNTFRLLREVYDERRRLALDPDSPFQSWKDALEKDHASLMSEWSAKAQRWEHYPIVFPENDGIPGEGGPLGCVESLLKMMAMSCDFALGIVRQRLGAPAGTASAGLGASIEKPLAALNRLLAEKRGNIAFLEGILAWATRVRPALERVARPLAERAGLSPVLSLFEMGEVILRGLLRDAYDPEARAFRLEALDVWDYKDWLRRHGASERVIESGPVRFNYNITFAYPCGSDPARGQLSAETVVRFLLHAASYRGAMFWRFKAGTGEAMIMPLYEVLSRRGVRFSFFHRLADVSASSAGRIESVTVAEQVRLKGDYRPAIQSGRVRAWPSAPLLDQIDDEDAARLAREGAGAELECPWAGLPDAAVRELRRGEDFDAVVFAVPIGALAGACRGLVENDPRWRDMVAHVKTAASANVQLWFRPGLEELGMKPDKWGLPRSAMPHTTSYAPPFFSWIDMSHVIPWEPWSRADAPRLLAYFTAAWPDADPGLGLCDRDYPARERQRLLLLAREWLSGHMLDYWPLAGAPGSPGGVDLDLLFDPSGTARSPADKLAAQYLRLNIAPSERYTLSLPGTARYRIGADESGYKNLFLAGDWTKTPLNVGCVEAAVMSGLASAQAARRSLGLPADRPIHSLDLGG